MALQPAIWRLHHAWSALVEIEPAPPVTMKRLIVQDGWPGSWKQAYSYDLLEVYGQLSDPGYAYAYDNRRRQTMRLLAGVLAPGARILDIGAAQGNFSLALAEEGYKVTWNDLRSELADYVRLKQEAGDIEFAPGNAFELGFPYLFDAVLVTEIIEHVAHPDEFLAYSARLVKPGGYVVMTTPNGAYFRNALPKFSEFVDPGVFRTAQFRPDADGHIFLLHPDEIQPLASRAGLEVDEIALFTNPLTSGFLKTGWLLRVLPRSVVAVLESATQNIPPEFSRRIQVQMGVRFRKPTDLRSL